VTAELNIAVQYHGFLFLFLFLLPGKTEWVHPEGNPYFGDSVRCDDTYFHVVTCFMNMLARNCGRLKYKSNDTVADRIHPDTHIGDLLLPLTLPPEFPDDALLITGSLTV
jgi:hypothetical protein